MYQAFVELEGPTWWINMTGSQPFLSDQGVLFLYLLIFVDFVANSYERGLEIAFSVSSFPPSDNFNSGTTCKESRNLVFQFPFTTLRYAILLRSNDMPTECLHQA